jgi:hypothetical protein
MNYYSQKKISYSLLKEFYQGLANARNFWANIDKEKDIVEEEYFIIGNIVDILLTEPDKYDSKFIVTDKIPSTTYNNLVSEVIKILNNLQISLSSIEDKELDTFIITARENIGFYSNWKDETVINKFRENCMEYLSLYNKCKEEGKSLISLDQEIEGKYLAEELRNGKYTQEFFSNVDKEFNQVEVYWNLKEVQFKSKLDKVIVKDNTIYITDIKTYFRNFYDNYYNHKLFVQAALYYMPFKFIKDIANNPLLITDSNNFDYSVNQESVELIELIRNPSYKIAPYFTFLTVDKSGANPPIPFKVDEVLLKNYMSDINIIRKDNGWSSEFTGVIPKSIELWEHIKKDQWIYPQELVNNNSIKLT